MPFDSQGFEIDDAIATSQAVYEVQFPEWGVRTVPANQTAVNPNFQFPPPGKKAIPSTLAAIAIGPRSTIDRCWVSWDRQKIINSIPAGSETPGFERISKVRPLSVDHPLAFAQATKAGILPSTGSFPVKNNDPKEAMQQGLLYVFPKQSGDANSLQSEDAANTTILPAKYADEAGAIWDLSIVSGGAFIAPYLELYLYLQPPMLALPTKRFPLVMGGATQVSSLNAYAPVAHIPIFGRRHIGLTLRSRRGLPGAVATDFRIGLLRCVRENQFAATSPPFEAPGGSALAVPLLQTVNFQLDHPNADYLNIYAKVPAAVEVQYDLFATD